MEKQQYCPAPVMERLVDEYGTSMLRMCCTYLKNEAQAEDAVQDAFVKIYRKWPGFESKAAEKAWIMRVTVNICKDVLRTAWKQRVTLVEEYPEIPAQTDVPREEGALFYEICKLNQRYREVILLYYYEQLNVTEISMVLSASQSTVSVRLSRARKMLARRLEGIQPDEL